MDSSSAASLLCMNCGIRLNRLQRHLVVDLDPRVIAMLSDWIAPSVITECDYICDACHDLARRSVNQNVNTEQEAGPSRQVGHTHVCILCGCSILRRQSDPVVRNNPSVLHQAIYDIVSNLIQPRQIMSSDRLCHPCWLRMKRSAQNVNVVEQESAVYSETEREMTPTSLTTQNEHPQIETEPPAVDSNASISLQNYRRAPNTSAHCVFMECTNGNLHRISDTLRATIIKQFRFYLPVHSRICGQHLLQNSWELLYNSPNSLATFTVEQIEHVFSFVNTFESNIDFDNVLNIDDHLFQYWLGTTKDNFRTILNNVPRITQMHRGICGLSAYLVKLRTGDSDERLSSLFRIPRRTLEKLIDKVREVLVQDFVPNNLGIRHVSRQQLLQCNLLIPNSVFDNVNNENVIVICDGTYIYLNKSSNYMFQKDSYSLHKYRNLIKPFLIVTCDGYILDCFGPYKATTSDADIMVSLFRDENAPLRAFFRENDIFVLDRGFRDSISLLQDCQYRAHMPESLLEGEYQLTTAQANRSRCITMCRWVVEVVNGYFKRDYKIFRQEYFHRALPHMMQDFQVAAALINKFGVRFRNRDEAEEMINIINERLYMVNNLANVVENNNLNRRYSSFTSITADRENLLEFPRMDYKDLVLFALGTYQIRQARSYFGEHIRFHGGYRIEVSQDTVNFPEIDLRGGQTRLIRGKIKSRHISRKQYFVYILISANIAGRQGIIEYCCNCLVGRRTVGCCAHVMTLVWYLGWARYERNISAPAFFLDDIVVREDESE